MINSDCSDKSSLSTQTAQTDHRYRRRLLRQIIIIDADCSDRSSLLTQTAQTDHRYRRILLRQIIVIDAYFSDRSSSSTQTAQTDHHYRRMLCRPIVVIDADGPALSTLSSSRLAFTAQIQFTSGQTILNAGCIPTAGGHRAVRVTRIGHRERNPKSRAVRVGLLPSHCAV